MGGWLGPRAGLDAVKKNLVGEGDITPNLKLRPQQGKGKPEWYEVRAGAGNGKN
jgi:hypothetical protein